MRLYNLVGMYNKVLGTNLTYDDAAKLQKKFSGHSTIVEIHTNTNPTPVKKQDEDDSLVSDIVTSIAVEAAIDLFSGSSSDDTSSSSDSGSSWDGGGGDFSGGGASGDW